MEMIEMFNECGVGGLKVLKPCGACFPLCKFVLVFFFWSHGSRFIRESRHFAIVCAFAGLLCRSGCLPASVGTLLCSLVLFLAGVLCQHFLCGLVPASMPAGLVLLSESLSV